VSVGCVVGEQVFGRWTDRPALGMQPTGDHYVGKPSATGQLGQLSLSSFRGR